MRQTNMPAMTAKTPLAPKIEAPPLEIWVTPVELLGLPIEMVVAVEIAGTPEGLVGVVVTPGAGLVGVSVTGQRVSVTMVLQTLLTQLVMVVVLVT